MAITHLKPGSCMSEAVRVGEIIFQAGQITGDQRTGIEVQTQQVLDGIDQAMAEFVCGQSDVFWIQVWLSVAAVVRSVNAVRTRLVDRGCLGPSRPLAPLWRSRGYGWKWSPSQ